MPNRIMEWMEALALLGAEGVEPAEAQAACARIEALERGRAVRRCADFRLLGLASGGEPDCPLAWLLRYAMGRSLAALADPECKPGFSLRAARCLAGSAGLPVYALEPHLSRDKWFGEQERKLAEVFEALVRKPAVLIIDEVDGWLGRREGSAAQVGAAHISECSTLLLQLERYRGAAVLTTNRVASLDPALQRRVDVDLHLELPGPAERMALWSIALGEECPLRSDELCVLACVPLSGGDIAATVREVRLKRGVLTVVALVAAARERARRASLWG
jgi:hypothetical protein